MILSLSLIFNFCVSSVSAASGDIIYVNGSGGNDSWDGQSATYISGTTSGPKLSIKNATGTVNSGGTVNIADGTYKGTNNTEIIICRDMNIIGQSQTGTIINGTDSAWIFKIQSSATVTIENLTITNGNAYNGGAIYNDGNLTVSDGRFTDNYAYVAGSAIYNHGTLAVVYSSFLNNDADGGFGDPAYNFAAGTIYNDGNLTVTDSYFTENYAGHGNGAAIHNNGVLILTGTDFIGNSAYGSGGAIYNDNALIMANSNFIANVAYAAGGAIYNIGALAVTDSSFLNNVAYGAFYAPYISIAGGAIYNDYGGTYAVNSCYFEGNIPQDIYNNTEASSGYGSGVITGSSGDHGATGKAASKTMPLQKAGLPLAGLISAVLLVLGGLTVPKRR
ncbi:MULTISPECIES: hypothetical protein [Methanobacterium]|uniref:Right handed beta helix domain-containing protein n=1 Tax=Methanobacterium bryantii TaxID=2161 RepID=A0A2A2H3X8_METBR|nr:MULTISPECIES: hypothetical protein [Methanobacterium]OEC84626.1 hypothetical protein A9507_15205 [Methanobacterium sp. A39]PAV04098.1 hypothetical protein ASJ80_03530 [Methanobacterium bryantii]